MGKYRFEVLQGSHCEGERELPENPVVAMQLKDKNTLDELYVYANMQGVDISKCQSVEDAKRDILRKTRTGPFIYYAPKEIPEKNAKYAGNIVETDTELDKIHNKSDMGPRGMKFRRLQSVGQEKEALKQRLAELEEQESKGIAHSNSNPVNDALNNSEFANDGLDIMTVNELREEAASLEIDLGNAKTKAEIIAKIRGAMASV